MLKNYLKKIIVVKDREGKLLDYDIVWGPSVEVKQKCVVVRFSIKVKGEDASRRMTLVLGKRIDGTLTGKNRIYYEVRELGDIEVNVNLGAISLHELEEVLYRE